MVEIESPRDQQKQVSPSRDDQPEQPQPQKKARQDRRKNAAEGQTEGQAADSSTQEQKARLALEKKREKMSNQYEVFAPKRVFNSRFTEYQFAEWRRRRNNLFVTIDTVVPSMPKKLLDEPDDAQYHLDIARIDEEIEAQQEEFKDLVAEQHEVRATMKDGQQGRNPIRDELRELFGELNTYNAEKKVKLGEIEKLNKKMQDIDKELLRMRKSVHPIYNEESKLEKGVKELQHRLQTNAWSKQDEAKLIKEIQQVQDSKPAFKKIEDLRRQIAQQKEAREAVKTSMAPTNKIINSLKEKIGKVKEKESVFDKSKQLKQYDLTNISVKIEKNLEKTRGLKQKKYELKESFYGKMCDYEIQQALIKDIEWISKTKLMVVERNERAEKYKAEQKERAEQRKKLAEERDRQRAEIKAQQEQRRAEQEARRKEYAESQLEKLDVNPYEEQIELCESLIYFVAKNRKTSRGQESNENGPAQSEESKDEATLAREKQLQEEVKKGKIEIAKSKKEREEGNELGSLKQERKARGRKRDGPSAFYYEDEDRVDLDFQTIQRFGKVEISPPTELDQLDDVNKKLVALREALKLKGLIDQAEGKAKLMEDQSFVESEEYLAAKAKYDEVDEATQKTVGKIQYEQRFSRQAQEEEVDGGRRANGDRGDRPQRGRRNDNGQRGGRGGNNGRRGRPRDLEFEGQAQGSEQQPRKQRQPREKIGGNMEAFPEM